MPYNAVTPWHFLKDALRLKEISRPFLKNSLRILEERLNIKEISSPFLKDALGNLKEKARKDFIFP